MNWYKIVKLALPIVDENPARYRYPPYLSVGHEDKPFDKIWVMYNDFSIDSRDLYNDEGAILTHEDEWPDKTDMFAKGRYDSKKHMVSLVYFPAILNDIPFERLIHAKKRVAAALDKEFDNPAIIEYN